MSAPVVTIKDARHAHTAAMRLANAADHHIDRETDLPPEIREHVKARLRQYADAVSAPFQQN